MQHFIWIIFFLGVSFSSFCQSTHLPTVKASHVYEDLSTEWLVFDEDRENYVPYLPQVHHSYRAMHLVLDFEQTPEKYENKYLGLALPQDTKVFWNNRLSASISSQQYLEVSLDSIKKIYSTKKILLSIYAEKSDAYPAYILTMSKSFQTQQSASRTVSQEVFVPIERNKFSHLDWLIVSNWLMVVLVVAFSMVIYPVVTRNSLYQTWVYFLRPATVLKRTELLPQIGFILYFGLVMGFIWTFYEVIFLEGFAQNSITIVFAWLKAAFWCGLIAFLRIVWIKLLATLYAQKSFLADIHMQLLINSSTFTIGFLFVGAIILTPLWRTIEPADSANWSGYFIAAVSTIFVIHSLLISYYLFRRTRISKLYLFSYLCATEILPLLVATKWILSIGF